ncbi:MAG: prepilin-type N-terminal cleavage/methylation domain-containing protein [Planctomycetota bacterium]|nr:prepilin-type N-terminal cleavage/methylation domain-containing protein [Planctomycetota bacterium]
MTSRRNTVKRGFTLIEILIVVVILGILAAIIVPQFTDAAQDANESSARSQLQSVRSQIELHRVQNNGAAPADLAELVTDNYIRAVPVWPAGFAATYSGGDLTLQYDATVDFDGDGTNDSGETGW